MIHLLDKKKIDLSIKKMKLEDPEVIKSIEKYLSKKRGYVFKMPHPNSPVILMLSGGLDSTIIWAYLLDVFKLEVFPIFLKRGQRRVKREEQSVDYYTAYYKSKYPHKFHAPIKMNVPIPPMEIRYPITDVSNSYVNKNKGQLLGIPCYSSSMINYAVQYAYYLGITSKITVRTIFSSFMPSDGLVMKYETLTALRANMLNTCIQTDDYSWQITSLPLEKEIGFHHDKHDFIRWAESKNIPLQKTYSCFMWGKRHCGKCSSCRTRKEAFMKANIMDKTKYQKSVTEIVKSTYQNIYLNLGIKRIYHNFFNANPFTK